MNPPSLTLTCQAFRKEGPLQFGKKWPILDNAQKERIIKSWWKYSNLPGKNLCNSLCFFNLPLRKDIKLLLGKLWPLIFLGKDNIWEGPSDLASLFYALWLVHCWALKLIGSPSVWKHLAPCLAGSRCSVITFFLCFRLSSSFFSLFPPLPPSFSPSRSSLLSAVNHRWVTIPPPPLTGSITLDKWLNLCEPQFPYL